VNKPEPTTAVI